MKKRKITIISLGGLLGISLLSITFLKVENLNFFQHDYVENYEVNSHDQSTAIGKFEDNSTTIINNDENLFKDTQSINNIPSMDNEEFIDLDGFATLEFSGGSDNHVGLVLNPVYRHTGGAKVLLFTGEENEFHRFDMLKNRVKKISVADRVFQITLMEIKIYKHDDNYPNIENPIEYEFRIAEL